MDCFPPLAKAADCVVPEIWLDKKSLKNLMIKPEAIWPQLNLHKSTIPEEGTSQLRSLPDNSSVARGNKRRLRKRYLFGRVMTPGGSCHFSVVLSYSGLAVSDFVLAVVVYVVQRVTTCILCWLFLVG